MDIAELSMILETLGPKEVTEQEMQEAIDIVKNAKNLVQEQQLIFYGLYKQYTVGDVNIPKPGMFDLVGKKKWDAWKSFEGFPKNNAALAYWYIAIQLVNPAQQGGIEGSTGDADLDGFGTTVSTLNVEYGGTMQWTSSEALFKAVTDDDIDALRKCLSNNTEESSSTQHKVQAKNEEGMTALHFAADRGYVAIAQLLLDEGANINAQDSTKYTPLMYAVTCEHKDMVELLVQRGADKSIRNDEEEAVTDFADVPPVITAILNKSSG